MQLLRCIYILSVHITVNITIALICTKHMLSDSVYFLDIMYIYNVVYNFFRHLVYIYSTLCYQTTFYISYMTLIMSHHIHIIHSVICNNNTTYLQLLYTLTSHITMHYMYCDHLSLNDWGNLQPRFRTLVYTSQYNGKVALPNSISLS